MAGKIMSMKEAIENHIPDGSSVAMSTFMEQLIVFAAAHEIIRQGKKNLTLIGPISDLLFDQIIGAGCVSEVKAAWVGNVMMGSAYQFRRAVEEKIPNAIKVIDYSNLTMALALHAAALGVPFLPTHSTLGSDILKENPHLTEFDSPVSADPAGNRRAHRLPGRRRSGCGARKGIGASRSQTRQHLHHRPRRDAVRNGARLRYR